MSILLYRRQYWILLYFMPTIQRLAAKLQLLHRTSFRETKLDYSTSIIGILILDNKYLALNWLVIIMKYYIYKCKWQNTALSYKAFKILTKLDKEGEKLDENYLPFTWTWQIIDSCLVTQWFLSLWFHLFSFYFLLLSLLLLFWAVTYLYLFSNSNIKNSAETISL